MKKRVTKKPPAWPTPAASPTLPAPTPEQNQRNARLVMEEGPVRMFWLCLDSHLEACIAYCEACYRSERSMFGIRAPSVEDEREALYRLKARHDCAHTDLAEVNLSLLTLEACR